MWAEWNLKMKAIDKQIEEYLNYCEKVRYMTKETLDSKRYVLYQFANKIPADDFCDVTNRMINIWFANEAHRTTKTNMTAVSKTTMRRRVIEIRCCLRWLKEMDYKIPAKISLLPFVKKQISQKTYYTKEEMESVLKFANDTEKLMIMMMFDSGLRLTEMRTLRARDVSGREIRVFGKGEKYAKVFITRKTQWLLECYISDKGLSGNDYLWGSQYADCKDEPISKATLTRWLKTPFLLASKSATDICIKDKYKSFHPHALRHSFATDLQRNGAPIAIIKELMRHEETRTTEVYMHFFDQFLIDDYDKWRLPDNSSCGKLIAI